MQARASGEERVKSVGVATLQPALRSSSTTLCLPRALAMWRGPSPFLKSAETDPSLGQRMLRSKTYSKPEVAPSQVVMASRSGEMRKSSSSAVLSSRFKSKSVLICSGPS
eukprot:2333953-Prymnesium_polylepis.6